MLTLSAEQARRLSDLYHQRARDAIGRALTAAFPALGERLGERLGELVTRAARSASAFEITDAACVGRLLACWVAHGAGFEARPEFAWALAILADPRRQQGAKAFQLCRRSAEQLPAKAAPNAVDRASFEAALGVLDRALLPIGTLGALVPGPRLRFGEPCDPEALEVRVTDADWRSSYQLKQGRWERAAPGPRPDSWQVRIDSAERPMPDSPPTRLTVLSRDQGKPSAIRVRLAAPQVCDAALHPLLRITDDAGMREWRGPAAADISLPLPARPDPPPPPRRLAPPIAVEDSPRYVSLVVESCAVRASGVPLGRIEAWIAVYAARQHLVAWHREALPRRSWPADGSVAEAGRAPRCRIERDGVEQAATAWLAGLAALDEQLLQRCESLLLAFERSSGVEQGRVQAEPAVMSGTASASWGWQDAAGLTGPPFMQGQGTFDLNACSLQLELQGQLQLGTTRGTLRLSCPGSFALKAEWARAQAATDWIAALAPVNQTFRLPFLASYQPLASADGCLASLAGPVSGALVGKCGLRLGGDGPGLQWFCQLNIEPLSVPVRVHDPLLGVIEQRELPLLPKTVLLDWSLG